MSSANLEHVPDSGRIGQTGMNESFTAKPLTIKQELFLEHYFDCEGSPTCIAERAGWMDKSGKPDRSNVDNMRKTRRMQIEIARRTNQMSKTVMTTRDFNVSKEDRLELLWMIAQGGAERITDKEGNMVFMNPAVSVAAVRTINEMLPGSLAPKEIEITHKQDNRSEQEIRDNIAKLNAEYQSLVAIDGQVIREEDVLAVTDLPEVTVEGKVSKRKKTHV